MSTEDVLAAIEAAPMGEPLTDEEREALAEVDAAGPWIPHAAVTIYLEARHAEEAPAAEE